MHESRVVPCAVQTTIGHRRVLVVVGGAVFSDTGDFLDGRATTEILDLATGRWSLLRVTLPVVRGSHGCAVQPDGTILAIGGGTHVNRRFIFLANVDALRLHEPPAHAGPQSGE
jgi:hypothetical protein